MKKGLVKVTGAMLAAVLIAGTAIQPCMAEPVPSVRAGVIDVYADKLTAAAAGGKETAYIEWLPVSGAARYAAYIKADTAPDYIQLDDELIRQYPTYCRADAVGIKAGSCRIKVVAFDADNAELASFESEPVSVGAYNRKGFAFAPNSFEKGTGLGGYKSDGTPKDGAVILYITDKNKNTVTCDIITDDKGGKTTGTGLGEIMQLIGQGYESRPFIIRFIGEIAPPFSREKFPYDITDEDIHSGIGEGERILPVRDNMKNVDKGGITFEGIGADTVLHFNLSFSGARSIEVRNLAFKDMTTSGEDGVTAANETNNFWVHNCDFFYGGQGRDSDQAKGDGSVDVKNTPDYGLINENHFWDNGKTLLCGLSETSDFRVTYALNWFDHSDSRHPRIRTGSVHIYNNYSDGVSKFGVGATSGCSAFAEGNYFRNVNEPMLISMQGSEGNGTGTFSGEPGGIIKAYDNIMVGSYLYIEGIKKDENGTKTYNTWADGYTVDTRNELLPDTLKTRSGGTSYNNFDTNIDLGVKAEDILPAKDVPAYVVKNAGRCGGGNFVFKFDNAKDDTDGEVNAQLAAALAAYRNKIVTVGGGVTTQPDTTAEPSSMTGVDGNTVFADRAAETEAFVSALPTQTDPDGNRAEEGVKPPTVPVPENAVIIPASDPVVCCEPDGIEVSAENCVVYNEETDDYQLVDTTKTASTVWKIPFEKQSGGVVYITGYFSISEGSGKWNMLRIIGKTADGKDGQVVSFASDSNRVLGLWKNGTDTGITFGDMARNKKYIYTFKIDLDNKHVVLDVNGKTMESDIDVSEVSSVTLITPKSKAISMTAALPVAYTLPEGKIIYGDWDDDGIITASDAVAILQYVLKPDDMNASEETLKKCDVDCDGRITASDSAMVLQKTLKNHIVMPAEKA